MENLQSSHAHSVLLRNLISRQDEQVRILQEIRDRPYTSTLGSASSSAAPVSPAASSAVPPLAGSNPSSACSNPLGYRLNSDNSSIISKRSTFSVRLGAPTYMEDLKASRAYKRLFCVTDCSTEPPHWFIRCQQPRAFPRPNFNREISQPPSLMVLPWADT